MKKRIWFFVLLFVSAGVTTAQTVLCPKPAISIKLLPVYNEEEEPDLTGFYIGGNIGFYFANKVTASYYNGRGVNNVDSVLNDRGSTIISQNHKAIKEALGGYDFQFNPEDLPLDMKYDPSINIGFFMKYNTTNNSGFFLLFNYTKLQAIGGFNIEVDMYNNGFSEPVYEQCNIYGVEERINFDFGYNRSFQIDKTAAFFLEGGLNINDTKLLHNKIQVAGLEFEITNPYYSMYNLQQGGMGAGVFVGAGFNLNFNNIFSLDPGVTCYLTRINMGDETPYRPNFTAFIRLTANNIL
ncbi:MAG: hypothetical protein KKA07_08215 [Bacteroidetes bacterium]|nr:hypothetical protein [Bacteroidota bacterium]MBU1719044.1 hypothetical protein [Bacteroidota bacterium]